MVSTKELIYQHLRDTGPCSIMAHAARVSTTYQQLKSLGKDIVTDVLEVLRDEDQGMHCIMLLLMNYPMTDWPYKPEGASWNVRSAQQAWLDWGVLNGFIDDSNVKRRPPIPPELLVKCTECGFDQMFRDGCRVKDVDNTYLCPRCSKTFVENKQK